MARRKKPQKKIEVDRFRCAYCGACVAVCKFNANELVETFLVIDEEECTLCMSCIKACPMRALAVKEVA
ncbi:4Fe-4S binding protein [Archaeoglobus veneficus]|nr:4Fe-4S binding protein [Archaeoglobus veneficus]